MEFAKSARNDMKGTNARSDELSVSLNIKELEQGDEVPKEIENRTELVEVEEKATNVCAGKVENIWSRSYSVEPCYSRRVNKAPVCFTMIALKRVRHKDEPTMK